MRKLVKYLYVIITVTIISMVTVIPVSAIDAPTSESIISVEVYRSVKEPNDQLYLIRYNISYGVLPTEEVDEAYIFRLMNGAVFLGATVAFPFVDSGYNYGIASIYFDAASAPAWNGAYTMYLDGNPTLVWNPALPSISNGLFTWIDEGTVAAAQTRLTTRLRYIGTLLQQDWGYTVMLLQDSALGKVLTDDGEEYYTNSILNLRTICPALFFQQMSSVEFESDVIVNERHSWGGDAWRTVQGTNWFAQTFTPDQQYEIVGVNLLMYRVGLPNTLTVSVRATLAGVPTGADLATGTYDGDTLTTTTSGEWIEVSLVDGSGENITLTSGTTYAIVVRATLGGVANYAQWSVDTDALYAGGNEASSVNSGVAWAAVAADMNFEILARGGLTPTTDRTENRNRGGWADYTNWATNWGIEPMFLSTIIWAIMMGILIWAVALVTGAWDTSVIVMAICTTYGWRSGFVDTIFMQGSFALFALLILYSFWRRS